MLANYFCNIFLNIHLMLTFTLYAENCCELDKVRATLGKLLVAIMKS